MDSIELYINGDLCDTGKSFGVRLRRQMISPAELNTKDAQASYSVTLPITRTNDRIFNYASVEEVKGKFVQTYEAELIINLHRVFKGNFRISEISKDGYKGNLVLPVAKTVKDIFGDSKLTDNAPFFIDFKDFTEYINYWNNKAKNGDTPPCIFPYVLYGLLPKTSSSSDGNTFTARDFWDSSVIVGMQDLPPSINVLNILKHIFESRGYTLTGTAFDDIRLNSLYVSYKNEKDYVQPWNYGRQAFIKLSGNWKNIDWGSNSFEKNCYTTDYDGSTYYTGDLFNSTRSRITVKEDSGANVLLTETKDTNGFTWSQCQVMIPMSGFYKIRLRGDINIDSRENWKTTDPVTGIQFVGGNASNDSNANSFEKKRYELKLLRDFGTADFGLSNARVNRRYYLNNLNQNTTWNEENTSKYFPKLDRTASGKERELMFIDPAENPNYVLGLCWGDRHNIPDINPRLPNRYTNYATIAAAKTGFSWDVGVNSNKPARVALPSPGYTKWGRLGQYGDEDENPNKGIDFSDGEQLENKVLDSNGNITDAGEGVNSLVLYRFKLGRYSNFTLSIPSDAGYTGKVFLHSIEGVATPYVSLQFDSEGLLTFSSIPGINTDTYLTLYLHYQDEVVSYNISDSLTINRLYDPDDIIDWEDTNKFRIAVNNAPESFARKGYFKGASRDNKWNGEGEINAIVWLEHGEILTLAASSDEGRYKRHNSSGKYGWANQNIDFELDISPFRIDEDWIKVNSSGNGSKSMNWNDPINFQTDVIDLVRFLPNDVRTDEFIDNFCKAFNLKLSQTGTTEFTLDVKQTKKAQQNNFIDIDTIASVQDKANQPLGLPSAYSIGFTINEDEEGFTKTGDSGGGLFYTGAPDGGIIEQKSSFSYNWFKTIRKVEGDKIVDIPLPVISKAEVWTTEMTYPEAMSKRYTNLAQRFWYFDGLLNDLGVTFHFGKNNDGNTLRLAKVTNVLPGLNTLSYKDENNTILNNYFSLLTDANSHYTLIDCYLQPEQYEEIGNGAKVRFNGDLYYVADVDGYDPLNKNMSTLKLIRLI